MATITKKGPSIQDVLAKALTEPMDTTELSRKTGVPEPSIRRTLAANPKLFKRKKGEGRVLWGRADGTAEPESVPTMREVLDEMESADMTDAQLAAALLSFNPYGGYTAERVKAQREGHEKALAKYRQLGTADEVSDIVEEVKGEREDPAESLPGPIADAVRADREQRKLRVTPTPKREWDNTKKRGAGRPTNEQGIPLLADGTPDSRYKYPPGTRQRSSGLPPGVLRAQRIADALDPTTHDWEFVRGPVDGGEEGVKGLTGFRLHRYYVLRDRKTGKEGFVGLGEMTKYAKVDPPAGPRAKVASSRSAFLAAFDEEGDEPVTPAKTRQPKAEAVVASEGQSRKVAFVG